MPVCGWTSPIFLYKELQSHTSQLTQYHRREYCEAPNQQPGRATRPTDAGPAWEWDRPTTLPLHCAAACMQNLYTVVMGGRRRLQQAREQIKILTKNISSIHTKEWQAIIWNADRSYNVYHYLTLPDLDDQKQRKVSFTFSFTRLVDVKILRYEPVVSIHLHCIRFTLHCSQSHTPIIRRYDTITLLIRNQHGWF